ncbi:ATP-grasp domain-containing protein [Methylosoma difficile]
MRIWFNKTFSTISAVFNNLRLNAKSGEVTIICTHNHSNAAAFIAADESYLEPHLTGEAYLDWCVEFCQSQRIGLFWPGKEAALISQHHDRFHAIGTQVMSVADAETLSLLDNKAEFYAALPPEVAQTMEFIAVNNLGDFNQAVQQLSKRHGSLCIKPAVSVFGLGFRILDTERDSITHLLKGVEYQIPLAELRQGMVNTRCFGTLLVMEHLAGPEWSVDCAGRHGELLCAVQRKKSPLAGHGQEIDNNPEIQGMVERLAAHYRLNGLFNIQFKEGKNGPRLLEINPRSSGGFGMACLAGVNLARVALQAFNGEKVVVPRIDYGLRVTEVGTPVVLRSVG